MIVNWTVRIKNKNFWMSFIPAILLLVQVVGAVFGFELELGDIGNKLLDVVNAVFAVLAILGVINDPTTATMNDSTRALLYSEPKED
jgi:phi LC3 family holin